MANDHPAYHGGRNYSEQVTDEHLTCRICMIPGYKDPHILSCGHTFCLPCLEGYLRANNLPLEGMGVCCACPICGLINKIPGGGPARLSKNLFYDNQVDKLLRRHNKDRGRDDTFYNIGNPHTYRQNEYGHASFDY